MDVCILYTLLGILSILYTLLGILSILYYVVSHGYSPLYCLYMMSLWILIPLSLYDVSMDTLCIWYPGYLLYDVYSSILWILLLPLFYDT